MQGDLQEAGLKVEQGGTTPARRQGFRGRSPLTVVVMVLAAVVGVVAVAYYQYLQLLQPVATAGASPLVVEIDRSMNSTAVAQLLAGRKLIRSPLAFRLYTRINKLDTRLQAGEYALSPADSVPSLVQQITSGRVVYHSFTVPEGLTLTQTADLLAQKGLVDGERFLRVVATFDTSPYPFLQGVSPGPKQLEGFLFPSTYQVPRDFREEDIIRLMLEQFGQVYGPELSSRADALGLSTLQLVTMASIIEREAKLDSERPLVASVFYNRIRRGMPLQSCATVQYVLGVVKPVLSEADTKTPSPYNTYLNLGLPPGPIAAPGKSSLEAAANPAVTDYLYFVTKGDGSHYFSKTLREHNQAAARYLSSER